MEQKKKIALIAALALLILIIGGGLFFLGGKKLLKPPKGEEETVFPLPVETTTTISEEIPTLSPERKEIISKLETHVVVIEKKSFSPQNLTIKLHDQVEWQNKDNETFQIKGQGWGDVPIEPGEVFSQPFENAGTFPYSCALHPDLKGTIVVQ